MLGLVRSATSQFESILLQLSRSLLALSPTLSSLLCSSASPLFSLLTCLPSPAMRFLSAALVVCGLSSISAQSSGLGFGADRTWNEQAVLRQLPVQSGQAQMAVEQSGLAQYTQQLKDYRVAEPIRMAPLTNKQYITQPIVEQKLVHQPIVQRQTVKQPILRLHHVQQPVLRTIYTQPVVRPKIIRTTQVQPELTQMPVLQVRQETREKRKKAEVEEKESRGKERVRTNMCIEINTIGFIY